MPTDIYFAGGNVRVKVDEEPRNVAEAFTSARGLPFRLTAQGGRGEVYVNPSTVAFWVVSEPLDDFAHPPEPPQEPAQPAEQRRPVTDIWGQPVRRKPRR